MIKNSLICVALWFVVSSCSDFLEPKSDSEYVPENAIALNEMLLGAAYPRAGIAFNAYLPLLDDDVCCTKKEGTVSTYDVTKLLGVQAIFSWQPDMFEKIRDYTSTKWPTWQHHYELILGANAVLDYIDKVEGTHEEKTLVEAQAYALRGFLYFNLVNLFGQPYNYNKKALGVPLKLNSGVEKKDLPRNTVEETYEQVLKDLGEAERLYLTLPGELQFRADYRTSLPMVQLLKSRVYLYMEDWTNAATYAKRVIEEWNFSLTNLNTVARSKSTTYYNFISFDCPETIWLFGSAADLQAFTGFSVSVKVGDRTKFWHLFNASAELLEGYKPGDLRKAEYIAKDNADSVTCLIYGKVEMSNTGGVAIPKFSQAFRVSEAYLNLAEAAAMDQDGTTALWALNALREKRFTPETYRETSGISGEALVSLIRQERRLEMCFEQHRWFDLRRYGMPSFTREWWTGAYVQTYMISKEDKGYTLPIPEAVINRSKVLKQNELASPR